MKKETKVIIKRYIDNNDFVVFSIYKMVGEKEICIATSKTLIKLGKHIVKIFDSE